jgi:hypothetical protein
MIAVELALRGASQLRLQGAIDATPSVLHLRVLRCNPLSATGSASDSTVKSAKHNFCFGRLQTEARTGELLEHGHLLEQQRADSSSP